MRKAFVMQQIEQTDLLADINPHDLAKEAKLGWLKKLLIVAIWPLIKPYIAKKIGAKLAEILDDLLMEF
jgi:hypothetical protein